MRRKRKNIQIKRTLNECCKILGFIYSRYVTNFTKVKMTNNYIKKKKEKIYFCQKTRGS